MEEATDAASEEGYLLEDAVPVNHINFTLGERGGRRITFRMKYGYCSRDAGVGSNVGKSAGEMQATE